MPGRTCLPTCLDLDGADEVEVDDVEVKDEMLDEDKAYTSNREEPGADKRKGAEKRGAEATKLKHDEPGGRGHKKGDDAYVNEATDELVEQITKRVAARILKSALAKK